MLSKKKVVPCHSAGPTEAAGLGSRGGGCGEEQQNTGPSVRGVLHSAASVQCSLWAEWCEPATLDGGSCAVLGCSIVLSAFCILSEKNLWAVPCCFQVADQVNPEVRSYAGSTYRDGDLS
jgi:hypothetical protein